MKILNIDKFVDKRGEIVFANNFNCSFFQRCYHITHSKKSIIRAWQGHQNESKAFWVTKGAFLFKWGFIDNFIKPNKNLKIETIILSFKEPKILTLPEGFTNGFQALENDSSVMVFSNRSIDNSKKDDYRWDNKYFTNGQWK